MTERLNKDLGYEEYLHQLSAKQGENVAEANKVTKFDLLPLIQDMPDIAQVFSFLKERAHSKA
jgi:hypothetical protein